MMFEDMIGVSANPFAVPANPVPMEPTELQRQLYTDDPKLDAPRSQAKDLSLDALLHEMRKAHRTTVTARLGVNPGEAYYTSPVYAPSAPTLLDDTGAGTPFDEEEVAPARDAVGADDVFGRYLADSFGGDTDPMQPILGGQSGVFPITPETYEPLMEILPPNIGSLSKYGYSEPLTDPNGQLLREALRKLVRSV